MRNIASRSSRPAALGGGRGRKARFNWGRFFRAIAYAIAAIVGIVVAVYLVHAVLGVRVIGVGGSSGEVYRPHADGDSFEYSEKVVISFDDVILAKGMHFAIAPQAPARARVTWPGRVEIIVRKTPGVTYTLTVQPETESVLRVKMHAPYVYHFTTPANVVVPAPVRREPFSPYRYGVLLHPEMNISDANPAARPLLEHLRELGAGYVRFDAAGAAIEPKYHQYDFAQLDSAAAALHARGITMLPILLQYSAPPWATHGQPYPAIWDSGTEYGAYAAAVAAHIHLRLPWITRVELLNEPNTENPNWWDAGGTANANPDGSATAKYLRAAYAAVKAVDPHVTVVAPATATGGDHVDSRKYLRNLYAAGCRVTICWDVLSIHNYEWENPADQLSQRIDARFDIYKDAQAIARQNGDPTPQVMLTEWGYSSGDSPDAFDPRVQARYIATGLNLLLDDPTVDGVTYVSVNDTSPAFWDSTGLVDERGDRKPAFGAFRSFARR